MAYNFENLRRINIPCKRILLLLLLFYRLIILNDWPQSVQDICNRERLGKALQRAACWLDGDHSALNEASLATRVTKSWLRYHEGSAGVWHFDLPDGKESGVVPLLLGKIVGPLAFSTDNRLEGRNEDLLNVSLD